MESREGAFNLLLPQNLQVDINDDAIVERGIARTFAFPPPNAPQDVKDAWEAATAGMSDKERMLATTPFLTTVLTSNIRFDEEGASVIVNEPGTPEYVNPFGSTAAEWSQMLSQMIDSSRAMEKIDPTHAERTKLLQAFADNLAGTA